MNSDGLTDRNYRLLNALVDRYIREGVPVGSKTLAQDTSIDLSAASIRNVMSDLEEQGLLTSPHTSAGRIPTAQAYRLFVDSMLETKLAVADVENWLEQQVKQKVEKQIARLASPTDLAESASGILSDLTQQAGLVMLPGQNDMAFRQIEFMPLSGSRVLAILVLNEEEVQNCVVKTDREYSQEELQKAAEFINQNYSGRSVREVSAGLIASMQRDRSLIDTLMQESIDVASKALQEVKSSSSDYVVAGQANLLDESNFDDRQRLKELFEAFQQKKEILHLMERCASGQGVQVFIGAESGFDVLDDFSVVTAPYQTSAQTIGVLGVIGPTRMAYSKVVPMVDVTARLLSAALKG